MNRAFKIGRVNKLDSGNIAPDYSYFRDSIFEFNINIGTCS